MDDELHPQLQRQLRSLGLDAGVAYEAHDLISGARYYWGGRRNFIRLEPGMGHVLRIRRAT